jgi:homoserine O-acetyltransferase
VELISSGASVLDLGCGRGGLLARLKRSGHERLVGIECDEQAVLACVQRHVDVIQADLDQAFPPFGDRQFDYVLLSQTLQAVKDVERVIDDMLRVGRIGIVSFPNFAFRPLRQMLADDGRAPRSAGVLRYEWYNSPNIRFFTIADFEEFCRNKGIRVHRCIALDTEVGAEVFEDPNRNADLAIFVLSRE